MSMMRKRGFAWAGEWAQTNSAVIVSQAILVCFN
jgi:hypothetical protein